MSTIKCYVLCALIDLHLSYDRRELAGHLLNEYANELDSTKRSIDFSYQTVFTWHALLDNRLTKAMQSERALEKELIQSKSHSIIMIRLRIALAQIYAS